MTTPENEILQLNPSPVDAPYGIRTAKVLKIWPLSVGDQMSMSKTISELLQKFVAGDDLSEAAMVGFIVDTIRENVVSILELVVDDDSLDIDSVLKGMTNDQAVHLCFEIYEMNYKAAVKNLKSLFQKISPMFLSERLAPQSVMDTATELKTSSKNLSEAED